MHVGKVLIVIGVGLVAAGALALLWDKLPLGRIPFGRLPGDINVQREGFRFSFPIVTCLIISILISLVLALFRK